MSSKNLKITTMPEPANNEANDSIVIDRGREVLAERLELCMLRSASYDPGSVDPAWAEFLGNCLEILEERRTGKKTINEGSGDGNNSDEELCKLQNFWIKELACLSSETSDGSHEVPLETLVPAWETTLQLLLEAECAKTDGVPVNGKEMRNILYSYFYDYAEEILTRPSRDGFLPAFLSGSDSAHVRDGLSLFFGDRLKARLLELLEKQPTGTLLVGRKQQAGTFLRPTSNVPPDRKLTEHQEKALAEFWKKAAVLMSLFLLAFTLTACGGEKTGEGEETQAENENGEAYPGTVAYEDEEEKNRDLFGIMHATVLDVQNGEKDGLFIYTLRDQEDPDNAWCLNSHDVGSIVCDVTSGKEVAVLFSGDIINDPDQVEFIAILNDAPYTIRKTEGTTTSNMMNSFTVRTTGGVEMTFIKDNCKVDKDALSTEPGSRLLIYYTEGGSADHYPLRVYKLPQKER